MKPAFVRADFQAQFNFGLNLDNFTNPPWLMIPQNGNAFVRLRNGGGLTLRNKPSSTAQLIIRDVANPNSSERDLVVQGLVPGTGFIEALDASGVVQVALSYTVKRPKEVSVSFTSISDAYGHRSVRSFAEVPQMINLANRLYGPQTNITFRLVGCRSQQVRYNLGPIIAYEDEIRFNFAGPWRTVLIGGPAGPNPVIAEWRAVFATGDISANLNVFFVWDIAHVDGCTLWGCSMIKDKAFLPNQTFAHEAGHYLGVGPHSRREEDLMFVTPHIFSVNIPKEQSDLMNPAP